MEFQSMRHDNQINAVRGEGQFPQIASHIDPTGFTDHLAQGHPVTGKQANLGQPDLQGVVTEQIVDYSVNLGTFPGHDIAPLRCGQPVIDSGPGHFPRFFQSQTMFNVITIPAFKDNYIWLLSKDGAAVVIDPGEADPVLEMLAQERLSLDSILITHHHNDHQGGIAQLLEYAPTAEVFGPARESITGKTRSLQGGERIPLAALNTDIRVMAVPGHTSGHLAYYMEGRLFCGDTLFAGGCGRIFEGTTAQLFDSLSLLAALPEDTWVHCAHEYTEANLRFALAVEPDNQDLRRRAEHVATLRANAMATIPSTLVMEKATNPFLRCHEPSVRAAAQHRDADAADPISVFKSLREWKDAF